MLTPRTARTVRIDGRRLYAITEGRQWFFLLSAGENQTVSGIMPSARRIGPHQHVAAFPNAVHACLCSRSRMARPASTGNATRSPTASPGPLHQTNQRFRTKTRCVGASDWYRSSTVSQALPRCRRRPVRQRPARALLAPSSVSVDGRRWRGTARVPRDRSSCGYAGIRNIQTEGDQLERFVVGLGVAFGGFAGTGPQWAPAISRRPPSSAQGRNRRRATRSGARPAGPAVPPPRRKSALKQAARTGKGRPGVAPSVADDGVRRNGLKRHSACAMAPPR